MQGRKTAQEDGVGVRECGPAGAGLSPEVLGTGTGWWGCGNSRPEVGSGGVGRAPLRNAVRGACSGAGAGALRREVA